ncbi:MAG: hypothetical protein ACNI27_08135 [Desulfovibrio sp.]
MPNSDIPRVFFDKRDYDLLQILQDVLSDKPSSRDYKKLLAPYLQPHGIKEMAASPGLRIAYAVINLLGSLNKKMASQRLQALRSLHDEVLTSASSAFRYNTARVLLQIMKELLRSDDEREQLLLAHDFRVATMGKPRFIRAQLAKYHLIEMPEEWNQLSFDDRVHDANTKGRKSPTHLIMDAWIKGIRKLTVVYYNYVDEKVVAELLEAADIMDISASVGIEFSAVYNDRYVRLIWQARGFLDRQEYIDFLGLQQVKSLLHKGKEVSAYQQQYVYRVLAKFNDSHRYTLENELGISIDPIVESEFMDFVGSGQPSVLHLSRFIHDQMTPLMQERFQGIKEEYLHADDGSKLALEEAVAEMNNITPAFLKKHYLDPEVNNDIPDPDVYTGDDELPDLLRLTPVEVVSTMRELHSTSYITLNCDDLAVEDVLCLLYDCEGYVTHLDFFSLKSGENPCSNRNININTLRQAINAETPILLKRLIHSIQGDLQQSGAANATERAEKLSDILYDISTLRTFYKGTTLRATMGSGSAGEAGVSRGMGMVVKDTLPIAAQKAAEDSDKLCLPVDIGVNERRTFIPYKGHSFLGKLTFKVLRKIPLFKYLGYRVKTDWLVQSYDMSNQSGGIVTLGGVGARQKDAFVLQEKRTKTKIPLSYLDSRLQNILKVFIGLVPAFCTFALTKDWWVLAYLGAFIWFGITGVRNIIQSVLGGGGIRRSPILRWNDFVSWSRICDSLLWTGFSVPLLDFLVKSTLLDKGMNINTMTNPLMLYSIMALVNGLYIFSHNLFRGLPRSAAIGNLFRSILSIPIAIVFNFAIGGLLGLAGVGTALAIDLILQKWAAVISKLASDCVAGVIEGLADRRTNIRTRLWDYQNKMRALFEVYAKIELLFPDKDVMELYNDPAQFINSVRKRKPGLEKVVMINSLDLLYFWMYQPRSTSALIQVLTPMSVEDRNVFLASQRILTQEREISQLFVDGIVGNKFAKALSFYLIRYSNYIRSLERLVDELNKRTPEPMDPINACNGCTPLE